jgi:hypothetical protein
MIKISQSLMKELTDYLNVSNPNFDKSASSYKNCGIYFKARYIDKIPILEEPSASMKEGIYFEYLCTGALPRDGSIPEPEKTLKGVLTTAYKRAEDASMLFNKIISHYNIEILKHGFSISTEEMTGIIDIWAKWDGKECIIDLKYSGLIDDKWSEFGWDTDSLNNKDSLMIQGVHYKILVEESLGLKDVPFYYFIFNSKDPTDMKIIEQVVDPEKFEIHRMGVKYAIKKLQELSTNGFKAFPNYRWCKECPLSENCTERQDYPQITKVYY